MTPSDVALLLGALGASFCWAACFSYLSGDRREDVSAIAAAAAVLVAAAATTAVVA